MKLKLGDIIDIIVPSSAPIDDQWITGFQILQSWGFRPRLAKGSFSPWLFHSNKNQKRSSFLNQAFFNTKSSAVWMLRGGYGLQKLMPSFIKGYSKNSKKKLFIGYSDGTVLHLYLNSQKQRTLQAPLICELPKLSNRELAHLKNILLGLKKEQVFKNLSCFSKEDFKKNKIKKKKQIKTLKAPIMGGNLTLLSSSVGTPWFPSFKSHFLFIEDVNEEDYKVDRLLHHLFYSGSLKGVKALLFGNFYPLSNNSLKIKVLKSFSDVCPIPMIFGLPFGHKKLHQPLPLETPAELSIQGDKADLKISWGK